ncbi:hypothetical protein NS283_02240 [Microbacterium testaceum]|nr:hypothetical protein NS283_02240 [Microbacterium testaceum]
MSARPRDVTARSFGIRPAGDVAARSFGIRPAEFVGDTPRPRRLERRVGHELRATARARRDGTTAHPTHLHETDDVPARK